MVGIYIYLHLLYGKDIVKCSIASDVTVIDRKMVKPKVTALKEVEFNKNNDMDTLFKVIKELKSVEISKISSSKNKIEIQFVKEQRDLVNSIVSRYDNVEHGMFNRSIIIKNKSSVKESSIDFLFGDVKIK
jgi:hypothetical protein